MRVLVAPDKFRGTLTAEQAGRAIATGWARTRPDDLLDVVPMADGGEGTLDTLVAALAGTIHDAEVSGPLGDPVRAPYGIVPSDRGTSAVIEMARASGLALLDPSRRDPLRATTRGTGELIREAIERHGPTAMIVCIGGSATNDGGAGMAQALGARLLDRNGDQVPPGGAGLLELASIDAGPVERLVRTIRVSVACDVDNPLTGPTGAAVVYGPQKGATPDDVLVLDRALGHFAAIVHRDLGIDVRDQPGAGAAGGLGAGLVAFLGARLRRGIDVVMGVVGLPERIDAADLVLTGEGRLDRSSLFGKTVAGVLRASLEGAVPARVLCGRADVELDVPVSSLVERFGEERALGDARGALEDLAMEVAAGTQA